MRTEVLVDKTQPKAMPNDSVFIVWVNECPQSTMKVFRDIDRASEYHISCIHAYGRGSFVCKKIT